MIALLSLILTLFEEYTLGSDIWRVSCYSDGWFHFRPISFPVEISENYSPITDMTCGRFICDLLLPNFDHIFAIKRCIHVPTWLLCNGGFFAWSAPSHYLNQCWSIVYLTLRNKIQWNTNRDSYTFIKEMHLNMSQFLGHFVSTSMCSSFSQQTPSHTFGGRIWRQNKQRWLKTLIKWLSEVIYTHMNRWFADLPKSVSPMKHYENI